MTTRALWLGIASTAAALAALAAPGCGRRSDEVQLAFISNNPHGFWTYAEAGCKAAEKELNAAGFKIKVDFKKPPEGGGMAAQQAIIEDLMLRGTKGIAISPADPTNLAGFLKTKVAGKANVIAADNDVLDTAARKVYVGTHNYRAGQAAGELVARVLPKGGKIAIFVGVNDATNAIERRQGVLDYLAGKKQKEMTERDPATASDLKIGDYLLIGTYTDGEKELVCQEKAEELLRAHPDVDCLVGLWEYNPPALLRAVRGFKGFKGEKKPFIVAFDENYDTMRGIQSGEIVGSVAQNPFKFGYDSIKILAHLAKNDESVLKHYTMDDKNRIYIDHTVVTKDGGGAGEAKVDEFFATLKKLKGE